MTYIQRIEKRLKKLEKEERKLVRYARKYDKVQAEATRVHTLLRRVKKRG